MQTPTVMMESVDLHEKTASRVRLNEMNLTKMSKMSKISMHDNINIFDKQIEYSKSSSVVKHNENVIENNKTEKSKDFNKVN